MYAVRALVACALTLAIAACGGGGGSDAAPAVDGNATGEPPVSSGTGTTSVPSPTPTLTSTPGYTSGGTQLYDRNPIVSSCDTGELRAAEKALALTKVNAIRALHRLPPVAYDLASDIQTSKSALISVANAKLTHTPTTDDKCYTAEGKDGSGSSNLYISYSNAPRTLASDTAVTAFLIDDGVLGASALAAAPVLVAHFVRPRRWYAVGEFSLEQCDRHVA